MSKWIKLMLIFVSVAGVATWWALRPAGLPAGIAAGNGRIEATEINIATKIPGRILEVLAREGDFVQAGAVLARMDTQVLRAQQAEARAQVRQAENAYRTAQSIVAQRESELAAAQAVVGQRLPSSMPPADASSARRPSPARVPPRGSNLTTIAPRCWARRLRSARRRPRWRRRVRASKRRNPR